MSMREVQPQVDQSEGGPTEAVRKVQDSGVESGRHADDLREKATCGCGAMGVAHPGWLYVLRCTKTGFYKIGHSRDVIRRILQIRAHYPHGFELVKCLPFGDSLAAEKYNHLRFKSKRMYGEWFALSSDDVDSICLVIGPRSAD